MSDSQDPKQVNNDLRNSQFGGGLIDADTVNAGRIGWDNIHLGQQTGRYQLIQSYRRINGSDRSLKKTHSKKPTPFKARKLQICEQPWLLKQMYPASFNTNTSFSQRNAH
ncbi:hypothetical protein [Nostoc sp. CALU 546]|uniref:hypothetical protein n=1 Tax=Nostoc sp. CALU 546 TaxID=1867241 RepID=UPI003B66F77A